MGILRLAVPKGPFLEQVATCSPYRPKLEEVSCFAERKLGMISVQQQRRRR
jgi:hypothetical protein